MIRRLLLLFLVSPAEQVSAELSPAKLVGDFVFLRSFFRKVAVGTPKMAIFQKIML